MSNTNSKTRLEVMKEEVDSMRFVSDAKPYISFILGEIERLFQKVTNIEHRLSKLEDRK